LLYPLDRTGEIDGKTSKIEIFAYDHLSITIVIILILRELTPKLFWEIVGTTLPLYHIFGKPQDKNFEQSLKSGL
jgi:hypothetical protein